MALALEGIPTSILSKHPELAPVMEALDAYDQGHPVTARCGECGELLTVTEVKETGEVWVMCGTKTLYRAHRTPVSAAPDHAPHRASVTIRKLLRQSSASKITDNTSTRPTTAKPGAERS